MISLEFRPEVGRAKSPSAPASLNPALIGRAIVAALGGFPFGFG